LLAHAEHRLLCVLKQKRLVSSLSPTEPALAWLGHGRKYVDCTSAATQARRPGSSSWARGLGKEVRRQSQEERRGCNDAPHLTQIG